MTKCLKDCNVALVMIDVIGQVQRPVTRSNREVSLIHAVSWLLQRTFRVALASLGIVRLVGLEPTRLTTLVPKTSLASITAQPHYVDDQGIEPCVKLHRFILIGCTYRQDMNLITYPLVPPGRDPKGIYRLHFNCGPHRA